MFNQHEITADEHRAWFDRASANPSRCLLLAEDDTGPFGFAQFSNVEVGGISDWGFYVRPNAPKGSGTRLCGLAIAHAFDTLNLHKICGQAISHNNASVAIHRKLGFVDEGLLREQKYVNGTYLSLICFGLLKRDWHRQAGNGN
jgi:RimJ/RimL family protein N-acetyltransferase